MSNATQMNTKLLPFSVQKHTLILAKFMSLYCKYVNISKYVKFLFYGCNHSLTFYSFSLLYIGVFS